MKGLAQQFGSLFGTSFAAACCLGVTAALSALTAIGAGFLINDAILIPMFLAFVSLSLWLLYRSARSHADLRPFWVSLGGGVLAFAGLWINPLMVIAGLTICVASSLWDFRRGRTARFDHVAETILGLFPTLSEAEQRVSLALYRLLARGAPVAGAGLAAETGVAQDAVEATLASWPNIHRDAEQRVVGYWGLALAKTKHRILVNGRQLHAWCALDTLFLPELLGASIRVESVCPMTQEPISLRVHASGVEPSERNPAAVSLIAPDRDAAHENIVASFCHYVNFFHTMRAAEEWCARHPGTLAVSLDAAWRLGQRRNALRYPAR